MSSRLRRMGLTVAIIAAAAGCDEPRRQPAPTPTVSPLTASPTVPTPTASDPPLTPGPGGSRYGVVNDVLVTVGATAGVPGACRVTDIVTIIRTFAHAIADDPATAAGFVGTGFAWYSVGGERAAGPVSIREPSAFRAYVQRRHGAGERQRLVALRANEDGNFQLRLVRVAADLPPGLGGPESVAEGKGAVDCRRRTVTAWSIAMQWGPPDYNEWPATFEGFTPGQLRAAVQTAVASLHRDR
jgi:hypothetical protein